MVNYTENQADIVCKLADLSNEKVWVKTLLALLARKNLISSNLLPYE